MRNFSTRSSQVAKSIQAFPFGGGCKIKVPRSKDKIGVRGIRFIAISEGWKEMTQTSILMINTKFNDV